MKVFKSDKVFVYSLPIASFVLVIMTLLFKDISIATVFSVGTFFIAKSFLTKIIKED